MNLAPNGKPSKLTPEQYRLVRTSAFKKWFGDWEKNAKAQYRGFGYLSGYKKGKNCSLATDENGEPKVFYHQTSLENYQELIKSGIIDFEIEYGGGKSDKLLPFGFYLKPDINDIFQGGKNYIQIPFFLNIRTIKTFEDRKELTEFYSKNFKEKLNKKSLTNYFKSEGIDCIRIIKDFDTWEVNFTETFLVLDKNNIKLADGTNTTFKANSANIRFAEGGLIAPNGKPSNLTPEQYKLVRTPAFKKWFGDWENDPENASKVLDKNGEPLVVYRGMPKKRRVGNVFKYNVNLFGTEGVAGRQTNKFAFYFTDIEKVAEGYVNDISEEEGGYVVKSYFLNVRKLFKAFTKKNQYEITFKQLYDLANTSGEPVYYKNYNGDIETDFKGNKLEVWNHDWEWKNRYNDKYTKREPFVFFVDWNKDQGNQYFWKLYLQSYLKYNGLVFYETTNNAIRLSSEEDLKPIYGDEFSKTYAVFEPNQIKLADGTNTKFDGSSDDIRYEIGGATKAFNYTIGGL